MIESSLVEKMEPLTIYVIYMINTPIGWNMQPLLLSLDISDELCSLCSVPVWKTLCSVDENAVIKLLKVIPPELLTETSENTDPF